MNDRIKQLADEATSYADTLDVADQKIYQKIRDREFAQLIAQECAKIADQAEPYKATDLILKHFGVEQ
jgi:hypothetical protein